MANSAISVQIVYAQPHTVWQRQLRLLPGATVGQAMQASGFFQQHPDFDASSVVTGIYGRVCAAEQALSDGARIEVYRPLIFDPMESRRRRAAHRKGRLSRM